MSDSPDDTPEIRTAEMPVLGRQLRETREAHGLAVEDISNRLRLSTRQVKALEEDDFTVLPEPMITRGFIRNYARLLELDPEPLLEAYRALVPSEPPRAISIPSANIPISNNGQRPWMIFIIGGLLIGVVLAVWLYTDGLAKNPAQESDTVPITETPESAMSNGYSESMPVPALPLAERMGDEATAVEGSTTTSGTDGAAPGDVIGSGESVGRQTAPVDSATTQAATVPTSGAKLEFRFTDASWVSVTDGNNQEILNKTKPAGSQEVVEGKPPLKIVIGNVGGSSLTYNGKAVDLGPHTRLNVARITLE